MDIAGPQTKPACACCEGCCAVCLENCPKLSESLCSIPMRSGRHRQRLAMLNFVHLAVGPERAWQMIAGMLHQNCSVFG